VEAANDYAAGDALKEWIEDENPLAENASAYSDLLGWAIGQTDWAEVAHALRDE
jgi:hypothetical protein